MFFMSAPENPFLNRRVAVRGKLGSMTRAEAAALVRKFGGKFVSAESEGIDLLLLGADELHEPATETCAAAVERLSETELWQRLGVLEETALTKRHFTPAMLAELVDVPVHVIRRWHRAGLLLATQTVHRLPYFAFEEIGIARRLAELVASGVSLESVRLRLAKFAKQFPNVERPLADLSFVVVGKRWSVRRGEQLLEASGQQQFDFEAFDDDEETPLPTLTLRHGQTGELPPTVEQLVAQAEACDAAGETTAAVELYRTALAAGGPNAELCFQLADCLFRLGDLSAARERYLLTIELDDQHVEARANLGCVLAELQQYDWAIAALQGALALHADYADAHFHLATIFDTLHRSTEAEIHWQRFAELSLGTPWAMLAEQRLAGEENDE